MFEQAEGRVPGVVVAAVAALVRHRFGVRGPVQLPQRDPAQYALAQGPADEGVLGSLHRAEQQCAGFEAAEEVPVALRRRVHREQVEGAAHDEPQHLRPLQGEAAQTGAVDLLAEAAESGQDRVVPERARVGETVCGRHLSAP